MLKKKGFVLILVMTFLGVIFIIGSSYLYMVTNEAKFVERQVDMRKAFFLAEAGLQRAVWRIKNNNIVNTETFQLKGIANSVNYLEDQNITVTITDLGNDLYQVVSSSQVGNSPKTINAILQKNPPSKVFDYAYFVNNWGWFYGSTITAVGDVRSNGRFDLRYGPRVEGDIYAGYEIYDGNQGIRGSGGDASHQHPFSEKLEMPNLNNLTYYENKAMSEAGKVIVNGVTLIDGVFGDDAGESGNIVLIGTNSNPVEITGTVVIRGDVVIKGVIEGQGVIYSGRNIYMADEVEYKNAPSSPRPASENPDVVDGWVNAHKDNDLVGFAAKENVILGNYELVVPWNYWFFGMGNEDVGMDGIPDTYDTYENDNIFQSQYEDLDGDGVKDNDYVWSNVVTQVPIQDFANCPPGVSWFGDIATDLGVDRIDGIIYTNHAITGLIESGIVNGAIVSKDEAIFYTVKLTMNYDERVNSKYTSGQNRLVDIDLPISKKVEIIRWWE